MSGASFWKGGGKRQGPSRPVSSIVPLWFARCQLDNHGNPISNLFNAAIALAEDPAFAGKFAFDDMLRCPIFDGQKAEDEVLVSIHHRLQDFGLRRVSLDITDEAVRFVSYKNKVHPLRDWLANLQWDQTLRIADWLHTYLGTDSNEYTKAIGVMFLVSMVKRIFEPGCQCDYMLVLEGPQGILKSQACRALGGNYYSDTLPDLGGDHVRVSMHLRGKWLIEAAELAAMMSRRVEAARLKAFLTTQVEQFTAKHARAETTEPRQCVFVGTTNDSDWNRDETGGRRYWPVVCGSIDIDSLRQDRDQLFAEAVYAYRQGAQSYPDRKFEETYIKPEQDARQWHDAWEQPVLDYLTGKTRVTLHDVGHGALSFLPSHFSESDQKRLSKVMKRLGWTAKRNTKSRWWEL